VKDFSSDNTTFLLDETEGLFAPGSTIDPNGLGFGEEISFWVELGDEPDDTLAISAERSGASIALGSAGINLDVGEDPPGAAESDLKFSGADSVDVFASTGDDTITGQGGSGTGQPYTGRQALFGQAGVDELHAGDSPLYTAALDGAQATTRSSPERREPRCRAASVTTRSSAARRSTPRGTRGPPAPCTWIWRWPGLRTPARQAPTRSPAWRRSTAPTSTMCCSAGRGST
jgi:hypothetical protein